MSALGSLLEALFFLTGFFLFVCVMVSIDGGV